MNEQLKNPDFQDLHPSGNMYPASPSYLTETELDREWERRHRQGQVGTAQGTSPKEGMSS
jgi:hypothetical protein